MKKKPTLFYPVLEGLAGIILLLSLPACSKEKAVQPEPDPPVLKDTVFKASYPTSQLKVSSLFYLSDTAWLKNKDLKEISGIVRSSEKDLFWAEEDSFNKNAIYLLNNRGQLLGTKYVKGVFNRDWEDIAGGPGPEEGQYYIYLGEIGDNLKIFPSIAVYRFKEPTTDPAYWKDSVIAGFDAIKLIYPDGPHNAEALMVDPITKDIYIITKGDTAGLYLAPYPQDVHNATSLKKLGTMPVSKVTAADISADGSQILIKNYDNVFYWKRKNKEPIAQCLQRQPQKLDY